ncbi:hypothetical protein ACOSP7_010686 [Xanthoceras sorbifolium]
MIIYRLQLYHSNKSEEKKNFFHKLLETHQIAYLKTHRLSCKQNRLSLFWETCIVSTSSIQKPKLVLNSYNVYLTMELHFVYQNLTVKLNKCIYQSRYFLDELC